MFLIHRRESLVNEQMNESFQSTSKAKLTSLGAKMILGKHAYYINTNEITGNFSCENFRSSHVKITCYLHMWKDHRCYCYTMIRAFRSGAFRRRNTGYKNPKLVAQNVSFQVFGRCFSFFTLQDQLVAQQEHLLRVEEMQHADWLIGSV